MKKLSILVLTSCFLVLAVQSLPSVAAGGSSVPSVSPADQAADAYNRGIKYRDKAWKLEEQAATASGEDRSKLEEKIRKEYQKAARAFEAAVDTNPDMYQAHSSLGYALRKLGKFDDSLASYDRALELEPTYSEAIEYRAEAYLGLNRLEDAKEAYMELFRSDRERADELMSAMKKWIDDRSGESGGVDKAAIEEFEDWVHERAEIAGHTASLSSSSDRAW